MLEPMKKTWLPVLLSVVLVPAISGIASAQTADEVITKMITALGGRDALSKLTSRRSIGTVVISTTNGDIPGTAEIDAKAPNKSRTHLELDLSAMGMADKMIVDQKFDGTTGFATNSMQGDMEISENQLQNAKNNLFPSPLMSMKERGVALEVLPKETLGGKSYLVLLATPKAGSPVKFYVDPDTYLPARTVVTVDAPAMGGKVEQTSELSDYREVMGVKVPYKLVNSSAQQTATFTFTKVEHNVDLPDSLFAKSPAPQPVVR
jgi:outer membrane lipoprotein-sorting protein